MNTAERRFTAAPLAGIELRTDNGRRSIAGYAAVHYVAGDAGTEFGLRGDLVERIMPGAFDGALTDDARGLYNHDVSHVLGRQGAGTMRLTSDPRGLRYEIDLPDTTTGRDVAELVARGDVTGSSFGFTMYGGEERYEREGDTHVRYIVRVGQLYDVGPVTFPAYTAASVAVRDDRGIDARLAELDAIEAARLAAAETQLNRRSDIIRRIRQIELGRLNIS